MGDEGPSILSALPLVIVWACLHLLSQVAAMLVFFFVCCDRSRPEVRSVLSSPGQALARWPCIAGALGAMYNTSLSGLSIALCGPHRDMSKLISLTRTVRGG